MGRGVGRGRPSHVFGLLRCLVGAVWVGVLAGDDQSVLRRYPRPQIYCFDPWKRQRQVHVTCAGKRVHLQHDLTCTGVYAKARWGLIGLREMTQACSGDTEGLKSTAS